MKLIELETEVSKIFYLLIFVVAGCAAPQHVVNQVSSHLDGKCKDLFLSEKNGGYQHVAQVHVNGKAVFALAKDNFGQKCAIARSGFDLPAQGGFFETPGSTSGWEQLEAIAISRCEQQNSQVKASCKVFARNNEIIWGRRIENTFK